jgi:hypothetical protein
LSAREAHVYGHVPVSAVTARDPAHHAAALLDPVVLACPDGRADVHVFWLYDVAPAIQRLARFEGEIHVRVDFFVFQVVGTRRDDLLDLIPGRLEVGVHEDQVFPHHGAEGDVVFRF